MMEQEDLELFIDQCKTRLRTFAKRSKLQWMRDLCVAIGELAPMRETLLATAEANEQIARERNALMREAARRDEAGFEAGVDEIRHVRDKLGTLEKALDVIAKCEDGCSVDRLRRIAQAALSSAERLPDGQ